MGDSVLTPFGGFKFTVLLENQVAGKIVKSCDTNDLKFALTVVDRINEFNDGLSEVKYLGWIKNNRTGEVF